MVTKYLQNIGCIYVQTLRYEYELIIDKFILVKVAIAESNSRRANESYDKLKWETYHSVKTLWKSTFCSIILKATFLLNDGLLYLTKLFAKNSIRASK